MWKALAAALACALAVIATDLAFSTTLLRVFRPTVTSPADGSIASPPIVVEWDGPRRMLVTLVRSGLRQDLGLHESPFEIERKNFAQDGQYEVEIRSPSLGRFVRAARRFHVRRPQAAAQAQGGDETSQPGTPPADMRTALERLRAEKNQVEADLVAAGQEKARLEAENRQLNNDIDELENFQDQTDQRLQEMEGQQSTLLQEHMLALQENQFLRQRLQSIPTCTTWGYLSLPRPQTVPPTRRVVLVSNGRGQVFRSEADCITIRRQDPTGISPCVCVGPVWDGMALP
jgi:hypothetical protein